MITHAELAASARSYLRAARVLNRQAGNSPDVAAYLCGYAIEMMLKARICQTIGWAGYPETGAEFREYGSFKTHKLDVLLHLSGSEERIKSHPSLPADWSIVLLWNPEQRYAPVGSKTADEAREMIEASERLMRALS